MSYVEAIEGNDKDLSVEEIEIHTEDGYCLAGNLYKPSGFPEAVILLNGATAVPALFYDAFATWACRAHNAYVLTYDYRGFGKSSTGHLRESKATMADWGITDQAAVLKYIVETMPNLPIRVIGHSLGGLCMMFQEHADRVESMTAIASGPAHILRHPLYFMPTALFFWMGIGPISTAILGYLPGKKIGLGADIPKGVFWQWRRWCITKGFHKPDWGKDLPEPDESRFKGDLQLIGVSDDTFIPPDVNADLATFYPAANVLPQKILKPSELGLKSIGHLKAFSRYNEVVWPIILPVK